MTTKKTRQLHWAPPTTIACDACGGTGRFQGLFHSGPCAGCHGSGLVQEADGSALPLEDVAAVLRARLTELQERVRRFMAHPEVIEAMRQIRKKRQKEAEARIGSRFD